MSGFTLLEVMIALAILAIALTALIQTASRHVQNLDGLKARTLAHWVGLNQIAEWQLKQRYPMAFSQGKEEEQGTETLGNWLWYWTIDWVETEDPAVDKLMVEVRREEQDRFPLTQSTAFVARAQGTAPKQGKQPPPQ